MNKTQVRSHCSSAQNSALAPIVLSQSLSPHPGPQDLMLSAPLLLRSQTHHDLLTLVTSFWTYQSCTLPRVFYSLSPRSVLLFPQTSVWPDILTQSLLKLNFSTPYLQKLIILLPLAPLASIPRLFASSPSALMNC